MFYFCQNIIQRFPYRQDLQTPRVFNYLICHKQFFLALADNVNLLFHDIVPSKHVTTINKGFNTCLRFLRLLSDLHQFSFYSLGQSEYFLLNVLSIKICAFLSAKAK